MDFELLDSLIQSKKEQFWEMSDQIWGFAEMRFKEDQSSRLQMEFLRNEGFTVEEGIGDIPTAFSARAGSGRPVIGLLGEYDALPKLSQEADVTVKKPLAEGAPGHGCGHHLLGTGCLGGRCGGEGLSSGASRPGHYCVFRLSRRGGRGRKGLYGAGGLL